MAPARRLSSSLLISAGLIAGIACGGESPTSPTPTPSPTPPAACQFTVSGAPSGPVAAATSELTINVTTTAGCAWSASSSATFITPVGATTGNGNGSAKFAVQANAGAARQGAVVVAGHTVTVSQDAVGTCAVTIAPETATVQSGASDFTVDVTPVDGQACSWTASSASPFITIKEGATGTGAGRAVLAIAANSGDARVGTATVGGRTVTLLQERFAPPAPGVCAFTISPTSTTASAGGGQVLVTITKTQGASCPWTVQPQASFLSLLSAGSGTDSGSVSIGVAANTGGPRTGSVLIAGQTLTVSQSGATSPMVAVVSYTSDPGSVVGRGQSATHTLSASEFTLTLDPTLSELRFFAAFSGSSRLSFQLKAPSGQTLVPGLYERAERWPFQAAGRPGLDAGTDSNGCNRVTGRFLISEAVYIGNLIQRFRARIEHHCEGASPAFRAEIWIDAQGSTSPPVLPPFPPGPASPTTFLTFQTDPGFTGGPHSRSYALSTAAFSGWRVTDAAQAVRITAGSLSSATASWQMVLSAPAGQPLQVGTYENAARFPGAGQPGLDFFGMDGFAFSCNTSTGRFVVHELVYGPQGELERFRATFETMCTGAPAGIRGEVVIAADPWR